MPAGHPDLGRDAQGRGVVRPDGRPDAADPAGQSVVQDGRGCLGGQALALAGAADLVADLWFGAAGAAGEQAAVAQHPTVGPVADGVPQQPVLPLRLGPPADPSCGLGQGRKRPPADGVGSRIAEDLVEFGSVLRPERPQPQPAGSSHPLSQQVRLQVDAAGCWPSAAPSVHASQMSIF